LAQQTIDGSIYVADILSNSAILSSCTDLNNDGVITVTDAALINACALRGDNFQVPGGGIHDYCTDLPSSILNINDTVHLRLGAIDYNQQTVEVEISNPDCRVAAYQFEVTGLVLSGSDNLIPPIEYPNTVQYNAGGTVLSVTAQDSSIDKTIGWRPLTRLHYTAITSSQICISQIVDVVNSNYEDVLHTIEGSCIQTVAVDEAGIYNVHIYPNPFDRKTTLEFEMQPTQTYTLQIMDVHGRIVRDYGELHSNKIEIERGSLGAGMYYYRLEGAAVQVGRMAIF
jgi:hypothetical protein